MAGESGATAAQVDAATAGGYAAAVETTLQTAAQDVANPPAPALDPWPVAASFPTQTDSENGVNRRNSVDTQKLQPWWRNQMTTRQDFPLQEHFAFFWHDHFATSNEKVRRPPYMLQQQQWFRRYGVGRFLDLLKAVSKSPATLVWLDGQVRSLLHAQGVTLFYPPDAGGWLSGPAWIGPTSRILCFNQGSTLLPTVQFGVVATDAWVQTAADNLGGLPLAVDDRTRPVTLAKSKGGRDGQRLVAQILLGGPDYQAMEQAVGGRRWNTAGTILPPLSFILPTAYRLPLA